jgi:hypothetical protein
LKACGSTGRCEERTTPVALPGRAARRTGRRRRTGRAPWQGRGGQGWSVLPSPRSRHAVAVVPARWPGICCCVLGSTPSPGRTRTVGSYVPTLTGAGPGNAFKDGVRQRRLRAGGGIRLPARRRPPQSVCKSLSPLTTPRTGENVVTGRRRARVLGPAGCGDITMPLDVAIGKSGLGERHPRHARSPPPAAC